LTVAWPAKLIVITPPHMQLHMQELFNAGMLAIMTVGEPGDQGAAVFGMHGMGVSTPSAAAVAEATVGLAMDMHMPNGGMFTMGLLSMMFAAGGPAAMVLFAGRTLKVLGATPNEHIIIAPEQTSCPIFYLFFYGRDSCSKAT
jgi:hypothetical protein